MSFAGLTLLGFLLGMRHALEADHLAAVATLTTRAKSLAEGVRMGAVWGLGHTVTLFAIGSAVLVLDTVVPETIASALELGVGLMLVVLGLSVFQRLLRNRVHFHVHRHEDGTAHVHAHAHDGQEMEAEEHPHQPHEHPHRFPRRALVVGLMHGMAGSAALVLLALDQAPTVATGLGYIAVFGLGSILGMALLSAAVSVPMRWSARSLTRFQRGVEGLVGVLTVALGLFVIYEQVRVLSS